MSFDFINDKNKKIHLIGIGGISMSGIAEILIENDYSVSGSDMKDSPLLSKLRKNGASIYIGQNKNNIKPNIDLVIYTAAISEDNPELIRAKELNIPTMDRASFLGDIMKSYKYNIAISGTHGKTTTTAMVSEIFLKTNLDPTIMVGGELNSIKGNIRVGKGEFFINEACEYKGSFLKFNPFIGVILNIDADHLDFYKDINDIQNTFKKFAELIPKNGFLIANLEDERVNSIISDLNCNIITYGITKGTVQAKNIVYNKQACASFEVFKNDVNLFKINLKVPGKYNILNALASISVALSANIDYKFIIEGLENFKGTHRRFEIKGVKNGVTVIDDYAHHPTEIKATLDAAKNYPHNKIFCVFQPHTYSRTLSLFDEFTNAFYNVDNLILTDIYAAREKDTGVINSDMLCDKIKSNGVNCKVFHDYKDILNYLRKNLSSGDVLFTIGAGDIFKLGEIFLEN
ncbi:UDP-N-acetylmuramate--L-alanine ligase [Clostridium acetireducens DSM 10703]|uniref:UDP-N-acetylmuramate--L-alanine ligase n=1 Tax=Clostridium acetireducens DSM 10703 TaxID=1121290 RepID=A0A1E8EZP2_9CLOT|nr:UDP-N-acetylmuramate--L-alanine ligase [Clostridium acetireducens]OFI06585.1 UDP-N-acetylmuramate--L-alanine ligase [Clostridium acetireducens DSM 10703]